MENDKKKISCSYALLVIVLFATVCFLTCYIVIDRKMNDDKCYNSNVNDNDSVGVNDNLPSNNIDVDNNGIINKTILSIDYSKECDFIQCDNPEERNIKINIVNGDIVIEGYGKTAKYLSGNAISLNYTNVHQGHDEVLFYITSDNKLFSIDRIECYLDNGYCDSFFDYDGNHSPNMLADNVLGFVYSDDGQRVFSTLFKHLNYRYLPVINTSNEILNVYLDFPSYYGGLERYNFVER